MQKHDLITVLQSIGMRTTIDLPEPLLRVARHLARHTGRSFSATVADLMQRGLEASAGGPAGLPAAPAVHPQTGLPLSRSRRPVTADDVAALEDDR